jgi:hypothetical protein
MLALFVFLAFVALTALASRYGTDSREGRDWQWRSSC